MIQRALQLCQQVAIGLGLDDPGSAWREDLRRLRLPESSAADLAESVVESGRRCGVAFLRHSYNRDEFTSALHGASAPLVLLAQHPQHGVLAAVVDRVDDSALTLRVLMDLGIGPAETMSSDDALVRLAGTNGVIGVLFPARVLPEAVLGVRGDAELRTPVQRLGELLLLEKGNIVLVYAYATLVGLFSLTLPLGVQAIIGLVSGGLFLQPIVILIAGVVLGTIITGVLQILQLEAVERIQQRIFARVALEFSLRVPRVSVEPSLMGDLPERMNRFFEVVTIQKSLGKLLTGTTTALLQVVFGLLLLTFYHPYFTLFGILLVVSLGVLLLVTGPRGLETSLMESKFKYRAVHWLEEIARAVSTFKAAGRGTPALTRMDEHVSGYLRSRQRHFRVLVVQAMVAVGLKTIVTGGLLILGSMLVIQRQITLGQFVAAELVIVTVLAGIERLVGSLANVYDVLTAVYKLGDVTDLELESVGGLAVPGGDEGLAVQIDALRYTYPSGERAALNGLHLDIRPGERLAVTGSDGAGASTLLAVLAGMLPGYTGIVTCGGITLRDLDPSLLRDQLGMHIGTNEIFEATVEDNVSLSRSGLGPAEVMRALERVGAADEVQALPLGLRTPLVSEGRGLPQMLRIRLLLARAMVGNPRLVLLDETLATAEPAARHALIHALTAREVPWTLVIVSHDPEVFRACDRVLVLREGTQYALGPWRELADDSLVRELVPGIWSAV